MAEALSTLPVSLGLVRLLQSFGGKKLPLGFVAERLGVTPEVARARIDDLAAERVVRVDSEGVSLLSA